MGFTGRIDTADIQHMVLHSLMVAARPDPRGPGGGLRGSQMADTVMASAASSPGAVCGNNGENAAFTKATPSGECWMNIDPDAPASQWFKPGKKYYVTFTGAPDRSGAKPGAPMKPIASRPLVISGTAIRQDAEGRFSLNDLHLAAVAGGANKQTTEPGKFLASP